jgi:beta-glucosidase-like glycosyl hydrolase
MIMHKHLSRMTLREKVAQMVVVDFRFEDADYERAVRWVKKEGVGGIRLAGGSVFEVPSLVNSFQKVAKFPLLVAADYEDGAGTEVAGATRFPTHRAVGATGSEEFAQLKGRHAAMEARALGVRWILGPSVAPGSFGDDPALGVRLAKAYLAGIWSAGSLPCARRFPDGPFAELVPVAGAVMAGPDFSADSGGGVLRGDLDFGGLVAADLGGSETERGRVEEGARGGVDFFLAPGDPDLVILALEEAVRSGRLAEAAIDRSVDRILSTKDRLGLFADRMTDVASVETVVGGMMSRAAAQRIAEAAVTLAGGVGRVDGPVALLGAPGVLEAELTRRQRVSEGSETCVVADLSRLDEARGRYRKVMVVVLGPPAEIPDVAGLVWAYGPDPASQRAAAKALFGEIEYRGVRTAGGKK